MTALPPLAQSRLQGPEAEQEKRPGEGGESCGLGTGPSKPKGCSKPKGTVASSTDKDHEGGTAPNDARRREK